MTRPPAAPVGPEGHANHPASGAAAGERAGAVPPRRRWLYGAAAAVVAAGGAGWAALAWRQGQTSAAAVPAGLWQQSFPTPEGGVLDLQALRGQPLVLNFWATWCPPCVEELPMLSRFHREQQVNGWVVLAIAVDQPSAVRKFLQTMPLAMPVVMAGLEGTDLSRSLGNATGGLPFTVVVGERGNIIQRKLGKVSEADLAQWAGLP